MHVTGLVLPKGKKEGGREEGDNQISFGHSLIQWVSKFVLKPRVSTASCLLCMYSRRLWHSLKILDLKNLFLLGKVKKKKNISQGL